MNQHPFARHAEICEKLSGPNRVRIIRGIMTKPLTTAQVADKLMLSAQVTHLQLTDLEKAGLCKKVSKGKRKPEDTWLADNPAVHELVSSATNLALEKQKVQAHLPFSLLSTPQMFQFALETAESPIGSRKMHEIVGQYNQSRVARLCFANLVERRKIPRPGVRGEHYSYDGIAMKEFVAAVNALVASLESEKK